MRISEFLVENKKKIMLILLSILVVVAIMYLNDKIDVSAMTLEEIEAGRQAKLDKAYNDLAKTMRSITSFVGGIAVISGFGTVIFHLTKLGSCGSNPQARAKVLQDMLTTAICIALLGGFNFIVSFVISFLLI